MSYTIIPASGTNAAIVSLNARPPVRTTAGQGGLTVPYTQHGSVLVPINMPTTNFLPLVRIPSQAIIQKVELALDAAPSTSLTGSLGLVFSSANDGTPSSLRSTYNTTSSVASIVSQSCFLYATDIVGYVAGFTDVTFKNAAGNSVADGFYVPSAANKPIWQALSAGGAGTLGIATSGASPGAFTSCATDPGGFFDIAWFETTTGVNTGTCQLSCRVTYAIAGA
jgi:hypothetical protein